MFKCVMLVCVGNICRSPMAEALLKKQQPHLKVISSGIGALAGKPADPLSEELMLEKGINLKDHYSQQINSVLVNASDLILAMEQKHIDVIHSKYPESRGKVYLITKWIDNQKIADPYKKDKKAFALALEQIDLGLQAWQKKLWP